MSEFHASGPQQLNHAYTNSSAISNGNLADMETRVTCEDRINLPIATPPERDADIYPARKIPTNVRAQSRSDAHRARINVRVRVPITWLG